MQYQVAAQVQPPVEEENQNAAVIVRPVDAAKSAEKQEAPLEAEKQIDSASGIED